MNILSKFLVASVAATAPCGVYAGKKENCYGKSYFCKLTKSGAAEAQKKLPMVTDAFQRRIYKRLIENGVTYIADANGKMTSDIEDTPELWNIKDSECDENGMFAPPRDMPIKCTLVKPGGDKSGGNPQSGGQGGRLDDHKLPTNEAGRRQAGQPKETDFCEFPGGWGFIILWVVLGLVAIGGGVGVFMMSRSSVPPADLVSEGDDSEDSEDVV